jgi:hypothetical protein
MLIDGDLEEKKCPRRVRSLCSFLPKSGIASLRLGDDVVRSVDKCAGGELTPNQLPHTQHHPQ